MVIHVGLDDTDAPDGMCTTYAALRVLVRLAELGLDAVGRPRLVRLNPNVPWKTRGNGALALRVGRGQGKPSTVGLWRGEPILAYPRGDDAPITQGLMDALKELLLSVSQLDCPETNPGLFVGHRRPPPSLYWRAVREFLKPEEVLPLAARAGYAWAPKGPRGIIGASAAVAWRPQDRTYELLAYRWPRRWGTPRAVDPASVARMERAYPSTFNNLEPTTGRIAIAPHSPCPVLLGIRGDDPDDLPPAFDLLECGEDPMAWLVLETNQGTDDHILALDPRRAASGQSIRARFRVAALPRVLPGGHVVVGLAPGPIDGMAYEPSKGFRRIVRALQPGDVVTAWGSLRASPRGLNLERLRVERLASLVVKVRNPPCPRCAKAMKSMGRGQGFRCVRCRLRSDRGEATFRVAARSVAPGLYEPPVTARRHLAKPIKRMA